MPKYKDIFSTLKNYSKGFHRSATEEENAIYDQKVAEVTDRIRADIEHAPEIIADEFAKLEILKWRQAFTKGTMMGHRYGAEWKALDNISSALMDTKPLSTEQKK